MITLMMGIKVASFVILVTGVVGILVKIFRDPSEEEEG